MSELTIIIPTACRVERAAAIHRAIDSALSSSSDAPVVMVVVNGPNVDEGLYASLAADSRVRLIRIKEGSSPLAVAVGRQQVQTPYFAFLDDDDELLAGASERRLALLRSDAIADVAIMNGYYQSGSGARSLMHPSLAHVGRNPLSALLDRNWMASCAAVFRAKTVGGEFFEDPHRFAEWTWLAFRLCTHGKVIRVLDEPGFIVHDTPNSLSKSTPYFESYISLFDRMLRQSAPGWVHRRVRVKRSAAFHDLSARALGMGDIRKAIRWHLRSIQHPSGWKYLLYGRKILISMLLSRRVL